MKRFSNPHLKTVGFLFTLAICLLTAASLWGRSSGTASQASANRHHAISGGYNKDLSVHLQGGNRSHLNPSRGHALITEYVGNTAAAMALRENRAEALALAAEDFDEDGSKDILAAYAYGAGGLVTMQRGNLDAIYGNTAEAQQRKRDGQFTDVPFFAEARVFELEDRPDFFAAGDFDADGHNDFVVATAKGRLSYFSGDGRGNFKPAEKREVEGVITALECADVNRRDGLPDLVLGIDGRDGAKAMVFESPDGAMGASAEMIDLPAAATGLAVANFDMDYHVDIAIAAGKELMLVKGRDRNLSTGQFAQVESPIIKRRSFDKRIRSLTQGQFSQAKGIELALLTEDGSVWMVEDLFNDRRTPGKVKKISSKEFSTAGRLFAARLANAATENLLVVDAPNRQLPILQTDGPSHSGRQKQVARASVSASPGRLILDDEPVAALALRLNGDGISDLVILRRRHSAITVTPSSTQTTFLVTTDGDSGMGSLREAIEQANINPGADQINFNLTGMRTISLLTPLPAITESLTIDATTQPGFSGTPIVELTSNLIAESVAGLVVNAANCTIRGLVINQVASTMEAGHGILINGNGAIIEGNFIGTNVSGGMALPNSGFGIRVLNAANVTIGGGTTAARNLVSGSLVGAIEVIGTQSTNVTIAGNFIGTNAAGTASLNGSDGIAIGANATGNTVGGLLAGQRNLISGNNTGVIIASSGNLVQGNFIGVDVTGNVDLGNAQSGVLLTDAMGNTVGGTVAGARNIISGNDGIGVFAVASTGNLIQGNFIGVNAAGTAGITNNNGGIILNDSSDSMVGGTTAGAGNLVAFNGDSGIRVLIGVNNAILGNSFHSNNGLGINLNDDGVSPNDVGDLDTGPNNTQNFPVLTSAAQEAGTTRVLGMLSSAPSTQYRVEFYANMDCDPTGNGEGESFLGSRMVTTDAVSGEANFNVQLPAVAAGQSITATATDPNNNTSEFGPCVLVLAGPGSADLMVSKTAAPAQVQAGTLATYTITVRNLGPETATNVTLNEFTPANTTFRSLNAPTGWFCNTPQQGAAGNISCTNPAITPGTTSIITLVVRVNPDTANGTVIRNTVKVTTATADLNPQNDSASANITAFNNCTLVCPANISRNSDANRCGATVNYTAPTGSGACDTVVCQPPSGAFFQRGTTTVNCSANSGPGCSFTVTVNDIQPPTISCPANVITQESTTSPGMATVTYSSPATGDNCQSVATVCVPPSGAIFPLGITPVNCLATDAGGNNASCSFTVTVQGGPPQLEVIIPGGNPGLVFGGNTPVPARRKPAKDKNSPCSIFSVENKGFTPVEIILDSVVRVGPDVDSRRIGDSNEGALYSVRRLIDGGGEVIVPIGGSVVIGIGQRIDFCVKFNPVLPIVPANSNNIPATLVLPDRTNSRVTFRVARGSSFSVNSVASVAGDLVLIDPTNTRRPPLITFERNGDEFVLTYSLFDANQDVQRMKVELLDGGGAVVASFDIDLVAPIRERNLLRGQSFTVIQRFSGANDNPQVTAARLTVNDALNTVTGQATLGGGGTPGQIGVQSESNSVMVLNRQLLRR